MHRCHDRVGKNFVDLGTVLGDIPRGRRVVLQGGTTGGIGDLPREIKSNQVVTRHGKREDVYPFVR